MHLLRRVATYFSAAFIVVSVITGTIIEWREREVSQYAQDTAHAMSLPTPEVRFPKPMFLAYMYYSEAAMAVFPKVDTDDRIHPATVRRSPHVINAEPWWLMRVSHASLRFAVAHEVCHVARGHTAYRHKSQTVIAAMELEANFCACQYLGERQCVESLRALTYDGPFTSLRGASDTALLRFVGHHPSVTEVRSR